MTDEAAINSNDTDQVMAMYDKDTMVMQPDGETVSGSTTFANGLRRTLGPIKPTGPRSSP